MRRHRLQGSPQATSRPFFTRRTVLIASALNFAAWMAVLPFHDPQQNIRGALAALAIGVLGCATLVANVGGFVLAARARSLLLMLVLILLLPASPLGPVAVAMMSGAFLRPKPGGRP